MAYGPSTSSLRLHYVYKTDLQRMNLLERRQKIFMQGAKNKFDMTVETYNQKLKMLEDDLSASDEKNIKRDEMINLIRGFVTDP